MTEFAIEAVGVSGPGMPGWHTARQVLRAERPFERDRLPRPDAAMLPANERRRAVASVRWALTAAQDAMSTTAYAPAEVASVFAASGADGDTLHALCEVLASPGREVSPTRFHNSVHNAPSGYWSIAAGVRKPAVSMCGFDASFAAGLVEAASQVHAEHAAVLLVAYDVPYPEPLRAVRPVTEPFAVALLLAPQPGRNALAICRLAIEPVTDDAPPAPADRPRAAVDNPAARAIPLLEMLACDRRGSVWLEYLDDSRVRIERLS